VGLLIDTDVLILAERDSSGGCAVLTRNRRDFERLAGVDVLPWEPAGSR